MDLTWLIWLFVLAQFFVPLYQKQMLALRRNRAFRGFEQRRKRLEGQLDAALQTIANNMLATQNLVDGFAAVATHLDPPVSQEAG